MKFKTTLAAIILAMTPALASAMCADMKPQPTAAICGDGQVWDTAAGVCVDPVTS